MPTVAIIGAGAAGLAAAHLLLQRGAKLRVFDKGRRAGGRMASRETAFGSFDHGAQYLRDTDERHPQMLSSVIATGSLAVWPKVSGEPGPPGWVGTPTINAVAQVWAQPLDLHCGVTVEAVIATGTRWQLRFAGERAPEDFDAVVVTVPTPQAKTLLGSATDIAILESVAYEPCWTLLWTPAALPADATEALVSERPDAIAWWAREDLKPGRRGPPRFIIHASAAWSSEYLELPADQIAQRLVDIAARRLRIGTESHFQLAHRWRYAFASRPLGMGFVELSPRLIYASDACLGSRIELALASGRAAAESLSTTLRAVLPA